MIGIDTVIEKVDKQIWILKYMKNYYRKSDSILGSSIIFLGLLNSLLTIGFSNFEFGLIPENVERVIISGASILITGFSAIQKKTKCGVQAGICNEAILNLRDFKLKLKEIIDLEEDYDMKAILKEYAQLLHKSPLVEDWARERYKKENPCRHIGGLGILKKTFYSWMLQAEKSKGTRKRCKSSLREVSVV